MSWGTGPSASSARLTGAPAAELVSRQWRSDEIQDKLTPRHFSRHLAGGNGHARANHPCAAEGRPAARRWTTAPSAGEIGASSNAASETDANPNAASKAGTNSNATSENSAGNTDSGSDTYPSSDPRRDDAEQHDSDQDCLHEIERRA